MTVGWVDCSSGASGDMLLGALEQLGALDGLGAACDSLTGLGAGYDVGTATRHGLVGRTVTVRGVGDQPVRRLADVLDVVAGADVPAAVAERAAAVFRRLADAEAAVHGIGAQDVHFHEVGAVDAIVDVLGCCLGLHTLQLDELVVSPVALGGGTARSAHGVIPVPAPAVLELLGRSDLIARGGTVQSELATPTGVAVLAEWATGSGWLPTMSVTGVGVGAGSRDLAEQPNLLRLVVGDRPDHRAGAEQLAAGGWCVLEANVDDLDPRLWPGVLDRLLGAGAVDAWLTPILMKKGRPAHTVSALTTGELAAAVRAEMLAETSTIGIRETAVGKHALHREWVTVDVDGQTVRVKVASEQGTRRNVSPEFDDVAAAARALGRPVKEILARAGAAALTLLEA